MSNIVSAGLFITRNCNLSCKYCNIYKNIIDMSYQKWIETIDIINNLGIKKITILGGEPTLYKDLSKVAKHIISKNVECSLITNAYNNENIILDLIKIGLNNISLSIDNLNIKDSISPIKAFNGIKLIESFKKSGFLEHVNIKVYTIITKKNINHIEELIKFMSEMQIEVYFLAYHWSKTNNFEHRKKINDFSFTSDDNNEIYNILKRIKLLKKQNYLVANSGCALNPLTHIFK